MAKIKSKERVLEYSEEFKYRVVELTNRLNVDAISISDALGLHPVMVYRWRQEYREGKLVDKPSRRISMIKHSKDKREDSSKELKALRKKVKELEKENDFLKKWDRYLKDQKRKDSSS